MIKSSVLITSAFLLLAPLSIAQAAAAYIQGVPFVPQAPFGHWNDERLAYACEEATILMAVGWLRSTSYSQTQAKAELIAMSEFERRNYGEFHDTSAADTLKLFQDYYGYPNLALQYNIGAADIKEQLLLGNIVIVHINGQKLGNPYYTQPGPPYHTLLIIGFDDSTQTFILHDPGTQHGSNMRFSYSAIRRSLMDYPTGWYAPQIYNRTAMIIISRTSLDKGGVRDLSLEQQPILIKGGNEALVYLLKDNIKRPFPNEQIFLLHGFKWEDIVLVDQQTLSFYSTGEIIQ